VREVWTEARSTIVDSLRENGCATIAQLADRIGISAQAVREHLQFLRREGVIVRETLPARVGRPPAAYRLKQG
jgi:predicted ArsR family transcriptional regulator